MPGSWCRLYAASSRSNAQIGTLVSVPCRPGPPQSGRSAHRPGGGRGSCRLLLGHGSSALCFTARGVLDAVGHAIRAGAARAAFWPATWAMAIELPVNRAMSSGGGTRPRRRPNCGGAAVRLLLASTTFDSLAVLAATGVMLLLPCLPARGARPKRRARQRATCSPYALAAPQDHRTRSLRLRLRAAVFPVPWRSPLRWL